MPATLGLTDDTPLPPRGIDNVLYLASSRAMLSDGIGNMAQSQHGEATGVQARRRQMGLKPHDQRSGFCNRREPRAMRTSPTHDRWPTGSLVASSPTPRGSAKILHQLAASPTAYVPRRNLALADLDDF